MSALLLALALSAEPTFSEPLYASCPEAPPSETVTKDQPVRVLVPGDVILSAARASRVACLMETCDLDRQSKAKLLDGPQGPKWWLTLASAFSFGLTVGAAVMVGLEKLGVLTGG